MREREKAREIERVRWSLEDRAPLLWRGIRAVTRSLISGAFICRQHPPARPQNPLQPPTPYNPPSLLLPPRPSPPHPLSYRISAPAPSTRLAAGVLRGFNRMPPSPRDTMRSGASDSSVLSVRVRVRVLTPRFAI